MAGHASASPQLSGPLSKSPNVGDLVLHEESQIICRRSAILENDTGAEDDLLVGRPVLTADSGVTYTPVPAASEASTAGLLLENHLAMADSATKAHVLFIVAGPAVLNKAKIDVTGLTAATVYTALEGLGFRLVDEPTKIETQTG